MSKSSVLLILFVCALLEAGGDALARKGMQTGRIGFYALAAVVLFSYGWLVNRPLWSFGSLLGVYVVLFFLVAQAISWIVFRERPTTPILCGGALIVSGGLLISFWR